VSQKGSTAETLVFKRRPRLWKFLLRTPSIVTTAATVGAVNASTLDGFLIRGAVWVAVVITVLIIWFILMAQGKADLLNLSMRQCDPRTEFQAAGYANLRGACLCSYLLPDSDMEWRDR